VNYKDFFRDKVVLITGASSGIGASLGKSLSESGSLVGLCARRIDRLEAVAKTLRRSDRHLICRLDVRDPASIHEAVDSIIKKFGRIDGVIVNAGYAVTGKFEKLTIEDYRHQFETNVFGAISTISAALPEIKKQRGFIGVIGSVNSYLSFDGVGAYAMSKFAVRALSESLYHELYPSGVSVTLVCPGFVKSEIRQVDNRGVFHSDGQDNLPKWIVMPTDQASRLILKGIAKKRREILITAHGKFAVFLKNHMPEFFHWLLRVFNVKAGKHKSVRAQ